MAMLQLPFEKKDKSSILIYARDWLILDKVMLVKQIGISSDMFHSISIPTKIKKSELDKVFCSEKRFFFNQCYKIEPL